MKETTSTRTTSMVQLGGGLGIAACLIGLAIFLAGCAGFNAVFMLWMIPMALGGIGFILSIAGPNLQKAVHIEDPCVFAAIFISLLGIIGSLLLAAPWFGWRIFP